MEVESSSVESVETDCDDCHCDDEDDDLERRLVLASTNKVKSDVSLQLFGRAKPRNHDVIFSE